MLGKSAWAGGPAGGTGFHSFAFFEKLRTDVPVKRSAPRSTFPGAAAGRTPVMSGASRGDVGLLVGRRPLTPAPRLIIPD